MCLLLKFVSDTFDYAAAKYKLTKHYDTMCKLRDHDLILKTLLPILFAKQVVTEDQRKIIEHRQKQDLDGMKVIIDDVIMPSLGQNMKDKYKGFLVAMEESDDKIFKDIPKKLGKYVYLHSSLYAIEIVIQYNSTVDPQLSASVIRTALFL